MKKIYVSPITYVVALRAHNPLMNISVSEKEVSATNAGFVKEDISSSSPSNYNVWDDDWSK